MSKFSTPTDEEVSSDDPTRASTPTTPIAQTTKLDFEADLLATRNLKANISNHLTQGGVPRNAKDLAMLLQVADSMDRASLAGLRLKVEQDANANAEELNKALIQQFLSDRTHKPVAPLPAPDATREIPQLPDDLSTRPFIEGETHQGTVHQTIDTFAARMGGIDFASEEAAAEADKKA